jgi:putative tricarboxylic transport membrane protein
MEVRVLFLVALVGAADQHPVAITEVSDNKEEIVTQLGRLLPNRVERRRLVRPVLTASAVGTVVGAMPGAGGDIAGLVSWDQSKRFSKHPEEYGKRSIEGLAAADTANNAQVGGAMATTLALGIPGDSVSAVLIGSMVIWGIAPGPSLYNEHPDIVWTIVGLLTISTVLATALSFARLKSVIKLLTMPKAFLWSLILIFCLVGSYAAQNQISDGSASVFFTSPISVVLLVLSAAAIVYPIIQRRRKHRSAVADVIATGTIHTPVATSDDPPAPAPEKTGASS